MTLKKFNKNKAINKISNKKNNVKTKKISIIVAIFLLTGAIIYLSFARFEATETFHLINGTIVSAPKKSLIEKMTDLEQSGASDLSYDGVASLGSTYGTSDNNLRYIGSNPYNFVYFNCSTTDVDEMNDSKCEKWRIIGLMSNIQDENGNVASRVKIMKDEPLGHYSWDVSDSTVNSGYGVNQWGESTLSDGSYYEGADLKVELNTDYVGDFTDSDKKWHSQNMYNHDYSYVDMPKTYLKSNALSMMDSVKWNLGSPSNNGGYYDKNWQTNITPLTSYKRERANTHGKLCSNQQFCNDTVVRTTTWIGKVGLMYPSDYGYSTSGGSTNDRKSCLNTSMYSWDDYDDCKNNSWMLSGNGYFSQWTISPSAYVKSNEYLSSDSDKVFYLGKGGFVSDNNAFFGASDYVRPVVYLKTNIYVYSGDGTSESPYKLVLGNPNTQGGGSSSSGDSQAEDEGAIASQLTDLKDVDNSSDLEYDDTSARNLRYIGPNPDNYIYFNCSTTDSTQMNDSTCEKWRIIGLMGNIEDTNGLLRPMVKIIRNESIGSYSWDTSSGEENTNSGSGINQWGASGTYEGADLMRELNTDYLGTVTVGIDGKWYAGGSDYKSAMPSATLNSNAQGMIETVVWNLGSPSNDFGYQDFSIPARTAYNRERYATHGKLCSSGSNCNDTVERTSTWTGKVGLMYPSDYGYATSGGTTTNRDSCLNMSIGGGTWSDYSDCFRNTWLHNSTVSQWTISPTAVSNHANSAFYTDIHGGIDANSAFYDRAVRPVVYLKSGVSIVDGNGKSSNPYKLSIN